MNNLQDLIGMIAIGSINILFFGYWLQYIKEWFIDIEERELELLENEDED